MTVMKQGKILELDIISSLDDNYTKIAFATSDDCDAFQDEMRLSMKKQQVVQIVLTTQDMTSRR